MNANLELYRVFCEVVKYKNISKAAESMYISQSAVTQSIQKLENILGGNLFFRNKNGVELTEVGKNLYEYIKDSIETMSNAENMFSSYNNLEKGKIRISAGNVLMNVLIMPTLIEFMKEYPNIEVSIISYSTENSLQMLANGDLDIVALNFSHMKKNYSNVEVTELKPVPTYCWFASKKYLEKKPINDIKDLEKHKIILPNLPTSNDRIDKFCRENGLDLKPTYTIYNSDMIKQLILNDIGIGYTNIENVRDIIDSGEAVVIKEVTSDNENDIASIATLKQTMCNKATLELIKRIKKKFDK